MKCWRDTSTTGSRKALVYASRTALVMLAVAAAVLLGLGAVAMLRSDNPEVGGWLRALFGQVFGVVAVSLAAILGVPSLIGLWGLAGSTGPDAVPDWTVN